MPRPAWLALGRPLTGMTEEIAPVWTRPTPSLVGQTICKTDHHGRPDRATPEPETADPNRQGVNHTMTTNLDAHCRRAGCRCDHIDCYQGWNTADETTAAPCQYCRPSTHERLWKAQAARAKGYPPEAVHRILRTITP